MNTSGKLVGLLLVFLALLVGLVGGVLFDRQVLMIGQARTPEDDDVLDLQLVQEAANVIDEAYADRSAVETTRLTYGAISGMVDALGDTGHSRFLTPEMAEEQRMLTQGEFEGIGAYIESVDGVPTIVAPFDDSPAQRAGLDPGTMILEVNGEEVVGMPLEQVISRILGPAGTRVRLTVRDPETGDVREVRITRERIELETITFAMLPGTSIAVIRVSRFSQGVSDDLVDALEEAEDAEATGLILDLRNNPGGLLYEAVDVTSKFLDEGNVLLEKDAEGNVDPIPVEPDGEAHEIPMVVLINEGSASAAEIVSGALQDYDRATLVGETTFGTGTVLNQFALSDGSVLLLATEQWLTPEGRVIWHEGIEPDITVELPSDVTPLIPQEIEELTEEELLETEDVQLVRAIELLSDE